MLQLAKKEKPVHKTKIGGQALIEGIMMRGTDKAAMAVRKKDKTVDVEVWDLKPNKWYQKVPFVRGIFNFIIQMADGYKYISKSAEKSGMMDEEEDEELTKFEIWLNEKCGEKLTGILMGIAMVLGVGIAVLLFFFVPTWLYSWLKGFFGDTDISAFRSLFEGLIKIALFVCYLWLTSLMKDVRRTYEYHGAEHKTIAAYEAGEELTVENVKKHVRFHPRCGTSFIFLTLGISILFYSLVPINSEVFISAFGVSQFVADLIRVFFKLLLLPVIVGLSYELLRVAGRHDDNIIMKIISAPGLALQRLTTKEPDDGQMEIAIEALKPVIPENKELDRW